MVLIARRSGPQAPPMEAEHAQPSCGFNDLPHALAVAVFARLSSRTLGFAAAVSRTWRQFASEAADWRQRYAELWDQLPPLPPAATASGSPNWQHLYGERQLASRCWLGRSALDKLAGHSGAAKACCLLPGHGILFTGGVDRVVAAWDLQSGIKLATSRRHGGTVRCIAVDSTLLASGSSDHSIRVWQRPASASASGSPGNAPLLPFDLPGGREVLTGHAGPVSCLQLSTDLIVSGSWDCSIRLWDRRTLECLHLQHTDDWVNCLSLRSGTLAAACGKEVAVFSLEGASLRHLASLACPSLAGGPSGSGSYAAGPHAITAVACSSDGRSVFMGTGDGGVWVAEVQRGGGGGGGGGNAPPASPRPVLLHQQAAEIAALSWDHPWLAVADRAGTVLLLDAGRDTPAGAAAVEGCAGAGSSGGTGRKRSGRSSRQAPQQRQARVLYSGGMGGAGAAVQCCCLDGFWAAAGLDCGTVLSWDGQQGLHQQAAAAAARQQKAERRQRNQQRQQQQQQRPSRSGGSGSSRSGNGGTDASGSARFAATLPVPLPLQPSPAGQQPSPAEQQSSPAEQQPSPAEQQPSSRAAGGALLGGSPSGRRLHVPPPPHPDALAAVPAAAGSCRQQAWQVLRHPKPPQPSLPAGPGGPLP